MLLFCLPVIGNTATNDSNEELWYQIEIIVFENMDQAGLSTEAWPLNPGQPDFDNLIELMPPQIAGMKDSGMINLDNSISGGPGIGAVSGSTAINQKIPAMGPDMPEPYQLLPDAELNLRSQEIKLSSSERYYPLLHVAWRQPVLSEEEAKEVHIYSHMDEVQTDDLQASSDSLAIPPSSESFMYQIATDNEPPLRVIDGTVTVTLGKYLHLDTDLLYRIQAEDTNEFSIFGFRSRDETPDVFRMHESRRMRSGELHYFDHPLFGMLALITPYQLPEQELDKAETIPLDESTSGE